MSATSRRLGAVILAGGRSKRFRSDVPKVLHPAVGRPLVVHVLETLRALHRATRLVGVSVVVPSGGQVEQALTGLSYPFSLTFAVQRRPLGTGDAARCGFEALGDVDEVLVLAGDAPLVRSDSLKGLVRERRKRKAPLSVLTAVLPEPGSYGRIVRDDGFITGVVEARDATPEQLLIREINTSTYAFSSDALDRTLPKLQNANAQGEYYLTDAVGLLASSGGPIAGVEGEATEALGTNTRAELAGVVGLLRRQILDDLMVSGVTVVDPAATYVDAGVKVGVDTVLLPNTYLEGETRVGRESTVGPNVHLVDTRVGDRARISFAVARQTRIGPDAEVGPFASLRAGTVLRKGAKAGTFVEMKAADVGEGSKVPHLSYMGDVTIGKGSNVGAGTITCNYNPFELAPDGTTKHRTVIGDDVYVSSDTMLVAPVRIGDGGQTGAGSVVNRNVEAGRLAYGVPARDRGPAKQRAKKDPKSGSAKGDRKAAKGARGRSKGSRKDS